MATADLEGDGMSVFAKTPINTGCVIATAYAIATAWTMLASLHFHETAGASQAVRAAETPLAGWRGPRSAGDLFLSPAQRDSANSPPAGKKIFAPVGKGWG
jgi:hypothetical protein